MRLCGSGPTHPGYGGHTMRIGLSFPRTLRPSLLPKIARELEDGGVEDLWVIEDCFYTAAPSLAAGALTVTERIEVGIGILPAVVRHPAITAMEIATLQELGSGRLVAGIGHGVQRWMEQIGLRPKSPLTALRETMTTVRSLLAGEEVTFDGETTQLDAVQLQNPPESSTPLLAGVRGPKSMQLAGEIADGVILAEPASPEYVTWAKKQAKSQGPFEIVAFAPWLVIDDGAMARRLMAPWLAGELSKSNQGFSVLSFHDELLDRADDVDALADLPPDLWSQLGPIGSPRDALTYFDNLAQVGVERVGVFPAPMEEYALADVGSLIELVRRRG